MPLASGPANGWSIVPSPNTSAANYNYLRSVTCVSASDCWAVGYSLELNTGIIFSQTLIERWDGTSWAITSSPNPSITQNFLLGVTCVSASDCWAVGYYLNATGSAYQTLIERWDGTAWAIVTSPNISPAQDNLLINVTCVSASQCWAVGYYKLGNAYQTLIERWDGISWAIVTSPNSLASTQNYLYGVTCASASDCWAAGYYLNATGSANQTLIERWDGTSWAIVSAPNTSTGQHNFLDGVTCVSASNCWAVGYYLNGAFQTLIERWDGTSWAIVNSPNAGTNQNNLLVGVTCLSASDCWAVGVYDPGPSRQTLIEQWDGTSWAIVNSPNTSTTESNFLYGVTCASASECWAVGYYNNGVADQTLIEHYTASPPTPTSVVSRKTHGAAGTFDVNLPLTGARGVECRSGGANNDYTMVFTFLNNLTSVASANVTSGTGSVTTSSIGPNPNQYTVNLTGVTTAQYITVTLNSVVDAAGNSGNVLSPQMGVLVGNVNASGRVDAADVSLVRQQTLQPVTSSTFRDDINISGRIDSADVSIARQQTLTSLPTPP
jgi:hypothetical protein